LTGSYGPWSVAQPGVWRFGADEAVIVPVLYKMLDGAELHMLAFSLGGGIMADWTGGKLARR